MLCTSKHGQHGSPTLESILSHLSGLVQSSPAYRFLFMSRYGWYTCTDKDVAA